MTILQFIATVISTGGVLTAAVTVYGRIKTKQIDAFVTERQQFISELSQLRNQMTELYSQHYKLMAENSDLRTKIRELENHVTKKSNQLKDYKALRNYHQSLSELINGDLNPLQFYTEVRRLTENVFSD